MIRNHHIVVKQASGNGEITFDPEQEIPLRNQRSGW